MTTASVTFDALSTATGYGARAGILTSGGTLQTYSELINLGNPTPVSGVISTTFELPSYGTWSVVIFGYTGTWPAITEGAWSQEFVMAPVSVTFDALTGASGYAARGGALVTAGAVQTYSEFINLGSPTPSGGVITTAFALPSSATWAMVLLGYTGTWPTVTEGEWSQEFVVGAPTGRTRVRFL